MLTKILSIKQRREQRIRQDISRYQKYIQQNQQEQQQLDQQQTVLWTEWRQANRQQHVVNGKLYQVQKSLNHFYQCNQQITKKKIVLQQELEQLIQQKTNCTKLLQRNLIEQEKLVYLSKEQL